MSEVTLNIGGMTCINCQSKIENALNVAEGIKAARVNWKNSWAKIEYDEDKINVKEIKKIIEDLDYKVIDKDAKESIKRTVFTSLLYLLVIFILFFLLQKTGLLNLLSPSKVADSKMSYALLFVTGLFTSVHCIAMCGGINLSQSLGGAKSGLKYNAGRLLSYTLIGLVLGTVGYFLGAASERLGDGRVIVPFSLQAVLKYVAGIFMVLMGLSMVSQGFALGSNTGSSIDSFEKKTIDRVEEKQIIKSKLSTRRYPNITVKKGIPVQWEIEADETSLTGCNYRMILRDFGLGVELGYGTNVIEFTPNKKGTFQYSCWMGMITGTIKVED